MDHDEELDARVWPACAIVLAGGKSRRMGSDKSMLLCDGIPLIERLVRRLTPRFEAMLLSTNQPATHAFLAVPMVADLFPDAGPMGGIVSALERSRHEVNFVIACDIVDPPHELIADLYALLQDHDAALPWIAEEDRYEPLYGWYSTRLAAPMRQALDRGARKMQDLLRQLDVAKFPIAPGALTNLNTPNDAQRHLHGGTD